MNERMGKKQKKNELNRAPFDEGNEADTSGVKCRSSFSSSSASASASASASSLFQPFRRGLVGLALVWLFYYGGRRRKKNAVEQQQQKKL